MIFTGARRFEQRVRYKDYNATPNISAHYVSALTNPSLSTYRVISISIIKLRKSNHSR